jgi:hypothetical protein
MASSLTRFLRKAAGIAAPIIGGTIGGPVGASIGGALGARVSGTGLSPLAGAVIGGLGAIAAPQITASAGTLLSRAGTALSGLLSPPGTTPLPQQEQLQQLSGPAGFMTTGLTPGGGFPGIPEAMGGEFIPAAAGLIGRGAGIAARGISRMAGNLVLSASGRIRGLMTQAGQFLSARRVMSGAKVLGLAGAASALGVGVDQLAQIVLQESTRHRRRGRGISASDLRRTRRTVRAITRMHRDLAELCGGAGFSRRRKLTPHVRPH